MVTRRRVIGGLAMSLAAGGLQAGGETQTRAGAAGRPREAERRGVVLDLRDFGAKGDGATKDTGALQQALERCGVLGGGEVVVPAGSYLTGAVALRSGTTLRLDKDAVLVGPGGL